MTFNPDNPDEHIEAMNAARAKAQAARRDARLDPVLRWRQGSRWHLVTECEKYSVAKAYVHRVPSYSAWFRPNTYLTTVPHSLGNHASIDLAKAACQGHADTYNKKHPTK